MLKYFSKNHKFWHSKEEKEKEKEIAFIKWSELIKSSNWWLDSSTKDKNGYIQLKGYARSYDKIGDLLENKIKCSRHFSSAVFKNNNTFIKGIDIERIVTISHIREIDYYILDARKNFNEVTDRCLERHNEIFILLVAAEKHLVELSIDSLNKIVILLSIVKEDLEQIMLLKEKELSQINSSEIELINKKLDNEIFISEKLREKRLELVSQLDNKN